ncbi:uncharacterized protein LOC101846585 [Aplysia californica]|uniref:Uncharacterized protein LOC101846585 n=1 Tax=Aplysia californica TaxID=6500 RepID=A0ABM0JRB6_APLCA|nr:uncharacterized protein LOC101846585 [Aplysia californica]
MKAQLITDEFNSWLEVHKPQCQANYNGSSGGMKVEGAKVLWGRSLLHKMRYTTLIGDGDSKSFAAVLVLNPYESIIPKKAECVNHVAKRRRLNVSSHTTQKL